MPRLDRDIHSAALATGSSVAEWIVESSPGNDDEVWLRPIYLVPAAQ